ncbi:isochorismate synthase [Candidatus Binatia bacterium]|nr:isochorismate synthase [Candidatus Binatia bacterium]
MTIPTRALEEVLDSLHGAATRAGERAARRGRPVLAVASAHTTAPEDLLSLTSRWRQGATTFFWERPAEAAAVLGLGAAIELQAAGKDRFARLREDVKRLTDAAVMVGETPPETPLLVGGFGFASQPSPGGVWSPFPPALFSIPEVLVARRAGHCIVRLGLAVESDTDVAGRIAGIRRDLARLIAAGEPPPPEPSPPAAYTLAPWPPVDEWVRRARAVVDDIRAGHFEKAVLARTCAVDADRDFDAAIVVRRVRRSYPTCTTFWLDREGSHFAGASPEMLVTLRNRQVETSAVAGSAPRGHSPESDRIERRGLRDSAKDRREHSLVVDGISGALRPLCEAVTAMPEAEVMTLENVHHLRTPVTARARAGVHLLDLVEALHPTPAVAGHPRAAALAALQRLEPFDRGWYAAPVGWIGADGGGQIAVAIRCALMHGRQALLYAGAGLVHGSEPEAELAETQTKLEPLLHALTESDWGPGGVRA